MATRMILLLKASYLKLVCSFIFIFLVCPGVKTQQRCSPSDPLGNNSNNLCPVHYHGIYGNSFARMGVGDQAFYGPPLGPNTPGNKIIDKRLHNDYFTNIQAGGVQGGISIKTNSGLTITIRGENITTN